MTTSPALEKAMTDFTLDRRLSMFEAAESRATAHVEANFEHPNDRHARKRRVELLVQFYLDALDDDELHKCDGEGCGKMVPTSACTFGDGTAYCPLCAWEQLL